MLSSSRMRLGIALAMAFAAGLASSAVAATPVTAQDLASAREKVVAACVARGETQSECACGARIAQQELDPRIFTLIPTVEPLLDQPPLVALPALIQALDGAGLSGSDALAAYETIRANRDRVKRECRPG